MEDEKPVNDPIPPTGEAELDELELTDEGKGESPVDSEDFLPGQIPPELQAVADGFKKAYTKKTQALSEKMKAAEASLSKAQLWDRALSDPRIVQFLSNLDNEGMDVGDEGSEGEEPIEGLTKAISPLQDRLQKLEQRSRELEIQKEKSEFLSTHPDWEQLVGKDGMEQSWRENPYASMEAAFQAAVGRKVLARRVANRNRQSAVVESPGSPRKSIEERPIGSFEDAVAQARRELGMR